ncbi:MAG: hypothetical protein RL226_2167 [Bacteroidota bacterium]|jgi:cytoskeletal protein CcmA (bactofilin family)
MMIKKNTRAIDASLERAINRIVEGTSFTGEIVCESNIRIDGKFDGDLTTKGRLVVGPQGEISGTVNCQNCEVEGRLKGRVVAEEMFSLKSTAVAEGEFYYGQLSIEPGASLTGACHMGNKIKDIKQADTKVARTAEERTA